MLFIIKYYNITVNHYEKRQSKALFGGGIMVRSMELPRSKSEAARRLPSRATVNTATFMLITGLLLGRAEIIGDIHAFGVAWLVAMFIARRPAVFAFLGVLAGRLTAVGGLGVVEIFSEVCIYGGLFALMLCVRRVYKGNRDGVYIIMSVVFYCLARSALVLAYEHTLYNAMSILLNTLTLGVSEIFFTRVLRTYLDSGKNTYEQSDAVYCTIFAALMAVGVGNVSIGVVGIRNVAVYTAVMCASYIFGAGVGTLLGTVLGTALGLAIGGDSVFAVESIALYALCGAVCGALKRMNRVAVGVIIFGIYVAVFVLLGGIARTSTTVELAIATLGFCLLPIRRMEDAARGLFESLLMTTSPIQTREYAEKVRIACCDRINEACNSSKKMHKLLNSYLVDTEKSNREQFDALIEKITQTVCCHCTMGSSCAFANNNKGRKHPTCEVAKLVAGLTYIGNNWRSKMAMYRSIPGIAVECLSDSIGRIKDNIESAMEIDATMTDKVQSECAAICKDIKGAAVLWGELGREVILELKTAGVTASDQQRLKEKCQDILATGLEERDSESGRICFVQKADYMLSTGVATVSLDRDGLCGDACTVVPFGRNGFMMAVADGCGTGYGALAESNRVMELLETMSQCGCNEDATVAFANTLMGLRCEGDRYSTADICIFNKYTGQTRFIKLGAVCSFIVSRGKVITVDCGAGPMGVVQEEKGATDGYKLKANDVIVMMTDGVYDACGGYDDPNEYFTDLLKDKKLGTAQEIADMVMQRALGNIKKQKDDMLVFCARVCKKY